MEESESGKLSVGLNTWNKKANRNIFMCSHPKYINAYVLISICMYIQLKSCGTWILRNLRNNSAQEAKLEGTVSAGPLGNRCWDEGRNPKEFGGGGDNIFKRWGRKWNWSGKYLNHDVDPFLWEERGMKAVLDKENLRLQCRLGNFLVNSRGEPKQRLPTRGAQGWVEGVTSSTSARFSHWWGLPRPSMAFAGKLRGILKALAKWRLLAGCTPCPWTGKFFIEGDLSSSFPQIQWQTFLPFRSMIP